MNFKSLFRVCVLAAMLLPIEAACSLSARPKGKPAADREYDPQTTASFFYTEGIKNNVMEGDTARSIRLFEKVLAIDSTHAPSLYELAILYAGAGAPEKALQYCLRANRLDTGNLWYRGQLGRLLIATNRLDSAMTVYRSLLRADPDNPDNYRLTAALYDQKGEYEQALAVLDSAQSRLGRIEILSSFRRQMLMSMGKYEQAVEEAKATVEDFPYEEQNYVALAELYAMLGLDSLAQRTYDEALALNPGSTPTIISLNEFYKQRKDNVRFLATAELLFRAPELPLETKLKFYDDLIRTPSFYRDNYFQIGKLASALAIAYPHDRRTRELYARHLIAGGNLEEALKLYKARIDDPEGRREALNNVLDIEAYLNRPDSVAKYAAEATRYYPSDPELYLRKGGVTAFFLKDYAAAEADYKQALKYARSDSLRSVIYGSLGDNCQNRGDYKNCFKYYDKGLRLDTTNAVIYNNYAYFLSLREERLDDARNGPESQPAVAEQSHLPRHLRMGSLHAGALRGSARADAPGRLARPDRQQGAADPLRRHTLQAERPLHGLDLLEKGLGERIRSRRNRETTQTDRIKWRPDDDCSSSACWPFSHGKPPARRWNRCEKTSSGPSGKSA